VKLVIAPGPPLAGRLTPPGDKSITHRALLLGMLARNATWIRGANPGEDCHSTARCAAALGALVEPREGGWHITPAPLHASADPLDCGNSGTTLRLLAGVVAARPFRSVLTGDASLRRRPVDRIIEPLRQMGARLHAQDHDRVPPLEIEGARLKPIRYDIPVPSAQVASCILLAALETEGETEITLPGPARDHTERMLKAAGVELRETPLAGGGRRVVLRGPATLPGGEIQVPGDFSAAAFFLAAAAAQPGARVEVEDVGLNPSRTRLLDVLECMGARIERSVREGPGGEPLGRVVVTGPERLTAADVPVEWVPGMIDEVPAWAVAASAAHGVSKLVGAGELRHKESDRIATLTRGLAVLGIEALERPDGLEITGGAPRGGRVEAAGDHRIAMAFAVLAPRARDPVEIDDAASIATSYPGFLGTLAALGGRIEPRPEGSGR
jgi:3-phosphoshikimate 1-carboxyvinyltransferase